MSMRTRCGRHPSPVKKFTVLRFFAASSSSRSRVGRGRVVRAEEAYKINTATKCRVRAENSTARVGHRCYYDAVLHWNHWNGHDKLLRVHNFLGTCGTTTQ